MKKTIQKYGFLNTSVTVVVFLTWISVFWIHGMLGVYAWSALKFIFPILGLIGVLGNLILLTVLLIKKNYRFKHLINTALCIVLASHLLLTMNILRLEYPIHINKTQPAVTGKWPLSKETVIGWGGDTVNNKLPHVIWPSERWAYDLVMEPYNTGSENPEDYGIWNQEVLCPVSGGVIAAEDDEADITPGSKDILSMEGNHVYMRITSTGTYLLLNHLKKDSVTVSVGEYVIPVRVLGRVGNSGSTSEPHLHIHHQRQNPVDTLYPILAEGLPLYFDGIDKEAMPVKGTVVTPTGYW